MDNNQYQPQSQYYFDQNTNQCFYYDASTDFSYPCIFDEATQQWCIDQSYMNQTGYNQNQYYDNTQKDYQKDYTNNNDYNNNYQKKFNNKNKKKEEPKKEEPKYDEYADEDPFLAKLKRQGLTTKKKEVKTDDVKPETKTEEQPKAQSKPEAKKETPKETKEEKPKDEEKDEGAADFKATLAKREALKKKYADIEEFNYNLNPANIVFIGHVDSGKSTMCGCVMLITGQVDERTIEKYEEEARNAKKESWWMAYMLDLYEEERAKGKTVDVGRAYFETAHYRFTILDAPGHSNYVPNMIQGAAQADIAVLVISAKEGEFESGFHGGQTIEHAVLARSLGIRQLVCAVNKLDDPTVNDPQRRFEEIKQTMIPDLKGKCAWNIEKDVSFIPVAALKKWNMNQEHVDSPINQWWKGNSMLEHLDSLKIEDRDKDKPLRFNILDRFKDNGTFVFGKVETGSIVKGQDIVICPWKKKAGVEAIYDSKDVEKRYAHPAENVKLKLRGIDDDDVMRGYTLCDPVDLVKVSNYLEVYVKVLELPKSEDDQEKIFSKGYRAVIHVHTVQAECEVDQILYMMDKKTKKKIKSPIIKKFCDGALKIKLEKPICIEKFEDNITMGRFTLRDENKTIAIGKIIKYQPFKYD